MTTDKELRASVTGASAKPSPQEQGRQVATGGQAARSRGAAGSSGSASAMSASASGRESAASAAAGAAGASAGGSIDLSASPPSLENSRGADWALPERAEGATAITRPIRVSCYADHLVIFPEKGQGKPPIVVPTKGQLREEVDELVSKVWERIDSWGIAGSRMYWRPVLEVHVQKGADQRYAELAQLLEGSGIVVTKQ
jgi:hypothetical protein